MAQRIRGQDVVVASVLVAAPEATHSALSRSIGLQRSHFSESVSRLSSWRLYSQRRQAVSSFRLHTFFVEAFPWLFPVEPGAEIISGLPVSHSGPILQDRLVYRERYVWPTSDVTAPERLESGRGIAPIHSRVVQAALHFPLAYTILSLAEALRVGKTREVSLARAELGEVLSHA